MEEPEVTTVSEKGQVVIPLTLREKLKLKPKTKLLVYGADDIIIMKKLYLPDLREDWERIKKIIEERNKKYPALKEEEVKEEVAAYRQKKTI